MDMDASSITGPLQRLERLAYSSSSSQSQQLQSHTIRPEAVCSSVDIDEFFMEYPDCVRSKSPIEVVGDEYECNYEDNTGYDNNDSDDDDDDDDDDSSGGDDTNDNCHGIDLDKKNDICNVDASSLKKKKKKHQRLGTQKDSRHCPIVVKDGITNDNNIRQHEHHRQPLEAIQEDEKKEEEEEEEVTVITEINPYQRRQQNMNSTTSSKQPQSTIMNSYHQNSKTTLNKNNTMDVSANNDNTINDGGGNYCNKNDNRKSNTVRHCPSYPSHGDDGGGGGGDVSRPTATASSKLSRHDLNQNAWVDHRNRHNPFQTAREVAAQQQTEREEVKNYSHTGRSDYPQQKQQQQQQQQQQHLVDSDYGPYGLQQQQPQQQQQQQQYHRQQGQMQQQNFQNPYRPHQEQQYPYFGSNVDHQQHNVQHQQQQHQQHQRQPSFRYGQDSSSWGQSSEWDDNIDNNVGAGGGGPYIPESLKRKFVPPKKGGASETNSTIVASGSGSGRNKPTVQPQVQAGGGVSIRSRPSSGNASRKATTGSSSNSSDCSKNSNSNNNNNNNHTHDNIAADNDELPEELQHLDKELVLKIQNEIMESGDTITFDDIAGLADAKQTVQEVVCWPMKRPDLFTGLRRAPNGLLLYGPPGTGKTLIGKAIAHESGATFFSISSSSLTSKWIGEGEKLVRTLFAVAAYREPAVVFIDEIDSLLTQRKESDNEASRRIKTEFLVQLDGTGTTGQGRVLVIGATNRPQELDEAARRRFVKRLYIPLPDEGDRRVLLHVMLKRNNHVLSDADMDRLAKSTEGFSGADLKALCTDAAMGPIRQLGDRALEVDVSDIPAISLKHFKKSLKATRPSVAPGDLIQYEEWDKTYGTKRSDGDDDDDSEEEE